MNQLYVRLFQENMVFIYYNYLRDVGVVYLVLYSHPKSCVANEIAEHSVTCCTLDHTYILLFAVRLLIMEGCDNIRVQKIL